MAIDRRNVIKLFASSAALGSQSLVGQSAGRRKKVIVAGAGIAGLACAYKLAKGNFDVVVLEAAGRSGGHILTIHDHLADGLYADAGAEHFYRPGYDQLWTYIDEFKLPVIEYSRRKNLMRWMAGRFYSPKDLSTASVLKGLGFNQREIEYLVKHSWGSLAGLYYADYFDRFKDEYRPFDSNLSQLDSMTARQHLLERGASTAGAGSLGGSQSALQAVWHAAIRRKRNMSWLEVNLFRIRGGNQLLTDAFSSRLGDRLRLGCPITEIEHSPRGVRVKFREAGKEKTEEADHLVTCLPLPSLRQISIKPEWPEAKR
jgi:monoamine oxidase